MYILRKRSGGTDYDRSGWLTVEEMTVEEEMGFSQQSH